MSSVAVYYLELCCSKARRKFFVQGERDEWNIFSVNRIWTRTWGWSIRFGGRGMFFLKKKTCTRIRSEKKNIHRLTAPKKNTCKGLRLIYIIYVNLQSQPKVSGHPQKKALPSFPSFNVATMMSTFLSIFF